MFKYSKNIPDFYEEDWYKYGQCGEEQYYSTAIYDIGERYLEMTCCEKCHYRQPETEPEIFTKKIKVDKKEYLKSIVNNIQYFINPENNRKLIKIQVNDDLTIIFKYNFGKNYDSEIKEDDKYFDCIIRNVENFSEYYFEMKKDLIEIET